jgi:hypothetical protein
MSVRLPVLLSVGLGVMAAGCNTYADDLARGQRAFESSEHERALAIFRSLEPDLERLSVADRARYDYLRGMTDFRIGYRMESRHWLSLSAAIEKDAPGSVPPGWAKRMGDALNELNEVVYTGGTATLSNTPSIPTAGAADDEGGDDEPRRRTTTVPFTPNGVPWQQ